MSKKIDNTETEVEFGDVTYVGTRTAIEQANITCSLLTRDNYLDLERLVVLQTLGIATYVTGTCLPAANVIQQAFNNPQPLSLAYGDFVWYRENKNKLYSLGNIDCIEVRKGKITYGVDDDMGFVREDLTYTGPADANSLMYLENVCVLELSTFKEIVDGNVQRHIENLLDEIRSA